MIDVALLAGRLMLLALLYLFLFAAVRAGVGMVSTGRASREGALTLTVVRGPQPLQNTTVAVTAPVIIGRSPGADIVVSDDFVSGRHARVVPAGAETLLEDLGSTNGTLLNGNRISGTQPLRPGDVIDVGSVRLEVG